MFLKTQHPRLPQNHLRRLLREKKLSYKDQREYDQLPAEIAALESAIATLESDIAAPDFYDQPSNVTVKKLDALSQTQGQLDGKVERWLEIEMLLE